MRKKDHAAAEERKTAAAAAAATPLGDVDVELLNNAKALELMSPAEVKSKQGEFPAAAIGGDTCATVTYVDRSFDVERRLPSDYHAFRRIATLVQPADFWETFGES